MIHQCNYDLPHVGRVTLTEKDGQITALDFTGQTLSAGLGTDHGTTSGKDSGQISNKVSGNVSGKAHGQTGRLTGQAVQHSESPLLRAAHTQLQEYLEGKRKSFDLPLNAEGTEFQRKVWEALCCIPYGATRSYKQIAEAVGNARACRAVGMANNRNPISIFIPCHRVIGADGSMVGYGGGLGIKQALLRLEGSL